MWIEEVGDMNYFLLTFLIWIFILGIVFWRRKVYLKKTEHERELERIRWRWWWAGNSFPVIVCKFLLLVGLVCMCANVVLQGLDIRERNKRMRMYEGQTSLRIVKQKVDAGMCICQAELYNGCMERIRVEHLLPNLGEVECGVGDGGQGDGVTILNKIGVDAPVVILSFDQGMRVNFSVNIKFLPRDFSINYTTSNGVLTNAMLHLDINQARFNVSKKEMRTGPAK